MTNSYSSMSSELMEIQLEKLALTRYEKEIAKGTITPDDVGGSALIRSIPDVDDVAPRDTHRARDKALVRDRLREHVGVTDADELRRARELSGGQYTAQLKATGSIGANHPLVGPGTVPGRRGTSQVYSGPDAGRLLRGITGQGTASMGDVSAAGTLGDIPRLFRAKTGVELPQVLSAPFERMRGALPAESPEDKSLTHATLRHELGEKALADDALQRGRAVTPAASHLGVRPILEEQIALRKDPAAARVMQRIRQRHPDDELMQRLIRHVGGTPDAPLPIGGRQERAVERLISQRPSSLDMNTRIRGFAMERQGLPVSYSPEEFRGGLLGSARSVLQDVRQKGLRAVPEILSSRKQKLLSYLLG